MSTYFLGVLTPFVLAGLYILGRDTVALYRSVIKYGGEDPRILSRPGRVIQRILQAITGRHREV